MLRPPFEPLTALSERVLGTPPDSVEEIAGGASPRRFFRIGVRAGRTAIGMYVPESSPERVQASERGRRWAFLEVRELLAARGLRVPGLLAEDCERGWLLVEDLGQTLAMHLERWPDDRARLYSLAVRDLARAQRALEGLPEDSIVRTRAFDVPLLRWEIDHFREWGLEARGVTLSSAERDEFDAGAAYLAETIARLERGFVHRDYQSRNLMVLSAGAMPELGWVDFQDALLGPRAYDLVALLADSYQSFDRAFVEARLAEFAAQRGLPDSARLELAREFELITIQRKLKDAGRFVFIERTRGDSGFLRFVPATLELVRAALGRVSGEAQLGAFAELLERLVPEFRR